MKRSEASPGTWRLAVLSTHPIQYHTPWFQALQAHPLINLEVFFAHRASSQDQARAGFGVEFEWDVPLLEGYRYRFLENQARNPGLDFWGIDLPRIGEVFEPGRFDAVLVHGWHYKGAWQALAACRKRKIPVMVRGDSQLAGRRSAAKRALKWLPYRLFISRLDACLCVGRRSRDYFRHYGARPDRIFEVPHVLDDRWFSEVVDSSKRAALRAKYGIPDEAFVPIFAGKLKPMKRPLDFLEATAQMDPARTVAVVVGDGELRAACQNFVERTGMRAWFPGFVNQAEMPLMYAMADALVLPSEGTETWGLVVNEAMSRGLPCVVSDAVGCAIDLVIEGETGAVFTCGNVTELVHKLGSLSRDRVLLARMGTRARSLIERYRPPAAVDGVLRALRYLQKKT